jgi:hypothetical protein
VVFEVGLAERARPDELSGDGHRDRQRRELLLRTQRLHDLLGFERRCFRPWPDEAVRRIARGERREGARREKDAEEKHAHVSLRS